MKAIKRLPVILFIGIFLIAHASIAQDYAELGQLGYRYSFRTSESGEDTARSVSGMRINVMLPIKLSEQTYLLPGLRYWQYNVDPGENFNYYFFQIGIQTRLNEAWTLQVLPLIRSGIYQNASFGDGLQFGLLATSSKQINSALQLGFGLYTNQEMFGQLLVPILAIDWKISERWRLFGNFPMYNTLVYMINERWNTGINYLGLITTFKGNGTYVERQSLDFAWFAEYYITSQLVAQFRIGYPVGRTFEEYNEDDKVDFTLSLFRFGDDRELIRAFDDAQLFAAFHLFFRMKKG